MAKYLLKLAIERPLVFLCGVAIPMPDKKEERNKDRRLILDKYIIDKSQKRDVNEEAAEKEYSFQPYVDK